MSGNKEIDNLLTQVMDSQGNMKACGRETCKELLKALKELYPEEDFGDLKSGFLNKDLIYNTFVKEENQQCE